MKVSESVNRTLNGRSQVSTNAIFKYKEGEKNGRFFSPSSSNLVVHFLNSSVLVDHVLVTIAVFNGVIRNIAPVSWCTMRPP